MKPQQEPIQALFGAIDQQQQQQPQLSTDAAQSTPAQIQISTTGTLSAPSFSMQHAPNTLHGDANMQPTQQQPQQPNNSVQVASFLPPFPPKHTYSFTPLYNERLKDQFQLQKMKTKERRQIESSLTRIHSAELLKQSQQMQDKDLNAEAAVTASLFKNVDEEWEQVQNMSDASVPLVAQPPNIVTEQQRDKKKKVINPYLLVVKPANPTNVVTQDTLVSLSDAQQNSTTLNASRNSKQANKSMSLKRPYVLMSTSNAEAIPSNTPDAPQIIEEKHHPVMRANTGQEEREWKKRKTEEILSTNNIVISDY